MGSWLGKAVLAWTLIGTLVPLAISQSSRFAQGWPIERSGLVPDPGVRWGSLENGFRYAILPVSDSEGSVSMRFAINVGSLRETEKEAGFAHLIEHLAFEGAGAFSGEEIDRLYKDWGLNLGSDVNGYTTHHFTSHRIDLNERNERALEQALELFRGFADGIWFEQTSVDKQIAIVLAEKLKYEQPLARFSEFAFGHTMKGTLYESRPVVGRAQTLQNATRERLISFYRKWYRPELMTLFVVGAVDPNAFEKQIERNFGSLEKRGRAGSPAIGEPYGSQSPRVELVSIDGLNRTLIDLSRAWQEPRGRDSDRLRERDFLRRFATELLNERCQRFVGVFDSDFVFYDTRFETTYVHARLTTSPGKWLTGVRFLDRIIRQATKYGFHSAEIESLRNRWMKGLRNRATLSRTYGIPNIADRLESNTMSGRVYQSPEDVIKREMRFLDSLDERELDRALKDLWRANGIALSIGGKLPEGVNGKKLSREFASYHRFNVEPYDYEPKDPVVWSASEKIGRVVFEQPVAGFEEAYRLEYENSINLTFLNTEFEPGSVRVLIRLNLPGQTESGSSNPALRSIALDSFLWSGVENYDWEEIHRELTSRLFDFSYSIEGNDCLCFRANCDPSEIGWFMNMIASYVRKGAVTERGFAFAKSNMLKGLQIELDGMALAKQGVQRTLFPERPELWDPELEDGFELKQSVVENWLKERLEHSKIEVTVVGDTNKESVMESIGRSIGALERKDPGRQALPQSSRGHPVPGVARLTYPENQSDGALAIGNWILRPGPNTFKESIALVFAERILRERIAAALRDSKALSYDTKVDYWTLPAFPEFQRFRIEANCRAENLDEVLRLIELTCRGMTRDLNDSEELHRVRQSLREEYDSGSRSNGYILENILFSVSDRPEWISDWTAIQGGILDEITPELIAEVCRKWLPWNAAIVAGLEPDLSLVSTAP